MDYLEITQVPSIYIKIADSLVQIQRCGLLTHTKLQIIARNIEESVDLEDKIDYIYQYLEITLGVDPSIIDIEELPYILDALYELNSVKELLAWQRTYRKEEQQIRSTIEYENRELAVMVNTIANAYGWPAEYIHNIQPEEAAAYMQEILMDRWANQQSAYILSEVAYDEKGRYKPFPKPDWYSLIKGPTVEEATGPVPARFVPDGVVYDFEEEAKKHKTGRQEIQNTAPES